MACKITSRHCKMLDWTFWSHDHKPVCIYNLQHRSPFATFSAGFPKMSMRESTGKFASGGDIGFEVCSPSTPRDFPSFPCREKKFLPQVGGTTSNLAKNASEGQHFEPFRKLRFACTFTSKVLFLQHAKAFSLQNLPVHLRKGPQIWPNTSKHYHSCDCSPGWSGRGPRPLRCGRTPRSSLQPLCSGGPGCLSCAVLNNLCGHLTTATGRAGIVIIESSDHVVSDVMTASLNRDSGPNYGCKWRTTYMRLRDLSVILELLRRNQHKYPNLDSI